MQTEIGQWYMDNAGTIAIATKDFTFAANPKKVKHWKLVPLMTYLAQWEYVERAQ